MNYLLHIFILISLYSILAVSLNLLAGYTGLLSICHAAFYGIGAYTTALLSLRLNWSWLVTLSIGMLISSIIALVLGTVSLRFKDDYFVIATFAFQVIIFSIMQNWVELTQGPLGLPGIAQPNIFGWNVSSNWEFLLLFLAFVTFIVIFINRLVNSPYGRVLRAIREDEIFTQSLGKNIAFYKISTFVIGAIIAAIAGSLYATYITFIDPSSFTVNESIFILAIVIIGGSGRVLGSIIGALFLIALPEALRFIGMPASIAANIRQILFGALLIICMMWRPQGLIGTYSYWRRGAPE